MKLKELNEIKSKYVSTVYDGYEWVIEVDGLKYDCTINRDDFFGYPWDEHDGHGYVDCRPGKNKRPGEVIIHKGLTSSLFYDFEKSIRKAKLENWGFAGDMQGLTPGQRAERAVFHDLNYCRAFAEGELFWVYLRVRKHGACPCCGPSEVLGGIESHCPLEYFNEVAAELAAELEKNSQAA